VDEILEETTHIFKTDRAPPRLDARSTTIEAREAREASDGGTAPIGERPPTTSRTRERPFHTQRERERKRERASNRCGH